MAKLDKFIIRKEKMPKILKNLKTYYFNFQ